VAPSAVECDLPGEGGGEFAVLVEGTPAGVAARAQTLRSLLSGSATLGGEPTVQDEPPSWWGSYPFADGGFGLKLSAPLDELAWAMTQLRDRIGAGLRLRGSIAAGVVHAGASPTTPVGDVAGALAAVRERLAGTGGSAVAVTAPSSTLDQLDVWGPVAGLELMRRVKAQFDPHGRFAAGRFVGGM
jgi:glycolate oxidase FAD binding subunit